MVPLSFGCGSAVFAAIATLAPSRAARNAIASPMPRLPPDTNSVLPLSDVIVPPLRCIPPIALSSVLLPRRLRATGPRIGSAEPSIRRHGDRIGGGLAKRFDHAMAFRPQGCKRVVGETALDPHFIRQPLMVQAGRRHPGRAVHAAVQPADAYPQ